MTFGMPHFCNCMFTLLMVVRDPLHEDERHILDPGTRGRRLRDGGPH